MVAAGLTAHISDMAKIGDDLPKTAPLADRVAQDIQKGFIRANVNAGISTAIEGGRMDENLVSALRMEAALVLGENAAQEIGFAVDNRNNNNSAVVGQLVAHAALGCVVGEAASNDCGSGAAGRVVGETVGLITKARLSEWVTKRVGDVRSGEISHTQLLEEFNDYQDAGVNVARLASGFVVAAAGGNADTAALTGANAAENNALCGGLCIGAVAILAAAYATHVGDGNPLEGLAVIGSGDDPLSQALEAGTTAAVEWSATEYPDQTFAVLDVIEATGETIDATITYIDDATGNEVSRRWNEIPEHTRNQIKGTKKIASIVLPTNSIKLLKSLKAASKGRQQTNKDSTNQQSTANSESDDKPNSTGTAVTNYWPPNDGFAGLTEIIELKRGARIDRYGGELDKDGNLKDKDGKFASPAGTPFNQRSLPASSSKKPYNAYRVIKPISNVESGRAAP